MADSQVSILLGAFVFASLVAAATFVAADSVILLSAALRDAAVAFLGSFVVAFLGAWTWHVLRS